MSAEQASRGCSIAPTFDIPPVGRYQELSKHSRVSSQLPFPAWITGTEIQLKLLFDSGKDRHKLGVRSVSLGELPNESLRLRSYIGGDPRGPPLASDDSNPDGTSRAHVSDNKPKPLASRVRKVDVKRTRNDRLPTRDAGRLRYNLSAEFNLESWRYRRSTSARREQRLGGGGIRQRKGPESEQTRNRIANTNTQLRSSVQRCDKKEKREGVQDSKRYRYEVRI